MKTKKLPILVLLLFGIGLILVGLYKFCSLFTDFFVLFIKKFPIYKQLQASLGSNLHFYITIFFFTVYILLLFLFIYRQYNMTKKIVKNKGLYKLKK